MLAYQGLILDLCGPRIKTVEIATINHRPDKQAPPGAFLLREINID